MHEETVSSSQAMVPFVEPKNAHAAPLVKLRERSDYLAAAKAKRVSTTGLVLQASKRVETSAPRTRYGITCSKKVGNAVARNRAKRRLRALANSVLPHLGRNGWDYVLIGRAQTTINQPFDMLLENLRFAIKKLHQSETR
ncbi:MAG: ribonuclease P protein component [Rhodobacteraceae bacterium]|nr:ribonuclease P protein component [Paracoccaceae bacterium]